MTIQSKPLRLTMAVLLAAGPLSYALARVPPGEQEHSAHGQPGHSMPNSDDHAGHHGPEALTTPRVPIPPLTDEDRAAVFIDERGHEVHDNAIASFLLLDQLEWQDSDEGEGFSWDVTGWVGTDINRLWLRSEGERSEGRTEDAELQLLWGHAIGPWWDVVAGVRQDFKPGAAQTWGAIGLQGLALYSFEAEATLYLGEGGQTAARLAGEYDILLTNRLILQPTAELNFYGKNDRRRDLGSGLADAEVGLRLRYEIRREFAPYIGVSWTKLYGNTADFAEERGASLEDTQLVIGIRAWF